MLLLVFALGYLAIALEHPLKIDKAAAAVLTGVACWTLLALGLGGDAGHVAGDHGSLDAVLLEHVGEIAQILFFLLGAMTIVELVDAYGGFRVVTDRVQTTNRVQLLWILSFITFFFSAVLDNLTTAIVMVALLRKLMTDKEDLWMFGGMVIIAANAGGAWSPIGDVTTIMLWIGGQITALNIIIQVFLPSLVCLLVPLGMLTLRLRGNLDRPAVLKADNGDGTGVSTGLQQLIFWLGVGGLLFVPVFKTVTGLPPFMGMLLSLGLLWLVTELLHRRLPDESRQELTVASVIRRIDTPSVLFFLGILLAVAALQTAGVLGQMATFLDREVGSIYVVNLLIGLLSSVVDNVPLVAGAMGMYSLETYPPDHPFWELLAYCAGTGGSCLIIGSAAGVAVMGLLRIDFLWYLRRMTLLALAGYLAGWLVLYVMS